MADLKIWVENNMVNFQQTGIKHPYGRADVEARYTETEVLFFHRKKKYLNEFLNSQQAFLFSEIQDETGTPVGATITDVQTYLSDKIGNFKKPLVPASPVGVDGDVQINASGSFGAIDTSGLNYDGTRLTLKKPFKVDSISTTSTTIEVNAIAGQTASLLDVKDVNSGSTLVVSPNGRVGVRRVPAYDLDVQGATIAFRNTGGVENIKFFTGTSQMTLGSDINFKAGANFNWFSHSAARLGIGTNAPTCRLHISNVFQRAALRIESGTNPIIFENGDIYNNAGVLKFYNGTTETNFCFTDIVQSYTKQQYFAETTLTDAASISWDVESNQTTSVTLTANRTLANPTNMQAGGTYIIRVIQGGTGSYTLSFDTAYVTADDSSVGFTKTIASTVGDFTTIKFYCDGSKMIGLN